MLLVPSEKPVSASSLHHGPTEKYDLSAFLLFSFWAFPSLALPSVWPAWTGRAGDDTTSHRLQRGSPLFFLFLCTSCRRTNDVLLHVSCRSVSLPS